LVQKPARISHLWVVPLHCSYALLHSESVEQYPLGLSLRQRLFATSQICQGEQSDEEPHRPLFASQIWVWLLQSSKLAQSASLPQ